MVKPLVLEFRRVYLSPEVLNMHAFVRKQRIVRELIVFLREEFVHRLGAAEHALGHCPHPVAVSEGAFAQKTSDGEVHGMVRGDHVHAPDPDLPVDEPLHQVGVRPWVGVDIALFVRFGAELPEAVPTLCGG